MFFELKNGKVVVTDQGLLNEAVKDLYDQDHSKNKERFHKMASYLFSVYDKRSIYQAMEIHDRQKLVSSDVVKDKDYWKNAEKNKSFRDIVDKLNQIQFSHTERLLHGCKKKIDEYIDYFDTMKISQENEKVYRSMVKGCEELFDYYDKLETKVNKEALSRQVGGGDSRMFEDE
jgi:hypothetical protein